MGVNCFLEKLFEGIKNWLSSSLYYVIMIIRYVKKGETS